MITSDLLKATAMNIIVNADESRACAMKVLCRKQSG